jgi:hypothetical protein
VSKSDGVASVWFFLFGEGEWGGFFFFFLFWGWLPCHYPTTKIVTKSFGNKSFMQPRKGSAWTCEGSRFFSFWDLEGVGVEFFFAFFPCSHHVPYVFPQGSSGSQVVTQNVPP